MSEKKNPQIVLIILDGWGYREDIIHNAVYSAKTPVFDEIWTKYPHALLEASGLAVGLPDGQMGNSEVGHTTIGAGKALDQDLVRIHKSIQNGELKNNASLLKIFNHVAKNNSVLHIHGLLSDGGVHSHMEHLFGIIKNAKEFGLKKVAIHIFTDGRDTPPQSAGAYIKRLEDIIEENGIGVISSISGRFYAMDRDNNWDRLEKAELALFKGIGEKCNSTVSEYINELYKKGTLDEHIIPIVCETPKEFGDGYGAPLQNNDAILFFNFRADRARMLSKKILEISKEKNTLFGTLTEYDSSFDCLVAFPNIKINTTLAKEISEHNLTQAHIAETEKFPHATYFLNGGIETPYKGEEHILLPSRKDILTHDLAPKMRAEAIADKAIEQIEKGTNFIFINFANPDMVGHTANVPAIIEALEETDLQLGRVLASLHKHNGQAFVTADHGNAEINIDLTTGEKHTSHTTNPVPIIFTNSTRKIKNGSLADIAPTILSIFQIQKPEEMTGNNLFD